MKPMTCLTYAGLVATVSTLWTFALPVQAHIVLEQQQALVGSTYKAVFKVGHGCGAAAIQQIVVNLPAGVRGAKPSPKAGWRVDIERVALAQPYESHGRRVTEDVSRITWTARTPDDALPNGFYDEFVLQAQLPEQAGTLYWPVSQVCDSARIDWAQTPLPGQAPQALPTPAPKLDLLPAQGMGAHQH